MPAAIEGSGRRGISPVEHTDYYPRIEIHVPNYVVLIETEEAGHFVRPDQRGVKIRQRSVRNATKQ